MESIDKTAEADKPKIKNETQLEISIENIGNLGDLHTISSDKQVFFPNQLGFQNHGPLACAHVPVQNFSFEIPGQGNDIPVGVVWKNS